jgi:hypothetical protein
MRQVLMLSAASLTILNGCTTPSIRNPVPETQQSSCESQKEIKPTISKLTEPATYVLRSFDHDDAAPLATIHLSTGDRLGFKREKDGSLLAVAGKQTFPVPEGTSGWVVVQKPSPDLHQKNELTAEVLDNTKTIIVATVGIVVLCCAVVAYFWYTSKHDDPF